MKRLHVNRNRTRRTRTRVTSTKVELGRSARDLRDSVRIRGQRTNLETRLCAGAGGTGTAGPWGITLAALSF